MTQVVRDTGLSRESLHKALSCARSPDFDTILQVVGALGLELHAATAPDSTARVVAQGAPYHRVMSTPAIDIEKLAPEERLRLISELWESLR